MQFLSIYFGLAVAKMHSFGAGLIGKQNSVMFTELGTNPDKKTGKLSTVGKCDAGMVTSTSPLGVKINGNREMMV